MRYSLSVTTTIFLATALATLFLILVWSGVSEAEASSGTADLTGAPTSTAPFEKSPDTDVLPVLKDEFPAYSQVVDNSEKKRSRASKWATESGKPRSYGEDYLVAKSSGKTKSASYRMKIPANDVYSVFAWWPKELDKKASARFGVETKSGTKWSTVDESRDGGYWVPIGEYEMKKGERRSIQIKPGSKEGFAVADAVAVVRGVQAFPPDPPEDKIGGGKSTVEGGGEVTYRGAATARRPIPPRQIMRRARNHIGTRYGNSRCKAFVQEDCSCFTKLVYRKWRKLPDSPKWQWNYGRRIARSNIRRGDLVFFDTSRDGKLGHWDHVGVYAGNGYLIHANNYYRYMKVHRQKMRYLPGYWGAKRLKG